VNSGFPPLAEVLAHEGVRWNSGFSLDLVGSNQYDIVGNGPDDETKTKYSDHYFNPLLNNGKGLGNAPNAASDYYLKLVEAMQSPRTTGRVSAGQGAAWSAHFLADMYVPYHVVGMPGDRALAADRDSSYLLDETITGPGYLYGRPTAPRVPEGGWGGGTNFARSIGRYIAYYRDMDPNANRDWFDPWYLNGPGLWDVKLWYGSHVRWEVLANQAYERSPYSGTRETDAPGWLNAMSEFDSAFALQGRQVMDYTISSARVTRTHIYEYWKSPEKGTYSAIEAVYAMWRASISALKPQIEVLPQGGDLYQLRATVTNIADEDVESVRLKLTVTGGQLQGEPLHDVPRIGRGGHTTYAWQVTAPSVDQLHATLEVIGSYQVTPDLQYARAESLRPLEVTVSPEAIRAGDKVTLMVRVEPPQVTTLRVIDWGPLERISDAVATSATGVFAREIAVKGDTSDGWYSVEVESPTTGMSGSAHFYVGDKQPARVTDCTEVEVTVSVNPTWKRSDGSDERSAFNMGSGGSTPGHVKGTFTGTTFTASWDEVSETSPMSMSPSTHSWGELTVDFDEDFTSVRHFSLDTEWEALDKTRVNPVRRSISISAVDIPLWDRRPTYYGGHEVFFWVEQDAVCNSHSLSIKNVAVEQDGTIVEMVGFTCEPTAGVAIMRLVFRTPPP